MNFQFHRQGEVGGTIPATSRNQGHPLALLTLPHNVRQGEGK